MAKANEINYFKAIGEEGREFAGNKPFSAENAGDLLIKIGFIQRFLPTPPARLIDFGCGTGWTSWMFCKMGYSVVGQDISPDMIQCANQNKLRFSAEDLVFEVCDYENLGYQEEFECALFFDCLHHATDEYAALQSAYRSLKPGGVCVAHEPGTGHSTEEHTLNEVQKYQVTEKDMPPRKIRDLASTIGFSEIQIVPFPEEALTSLLTAHDGKQVPSRGRGFFEKRKHRKRLGSLFGGVFSLFNRLDDSGLVILKK
ncbi:MAG: class I SAM-dependent methyltransferase [Planctomycetota bacterium]|nr:class I SAM-dependent methyltransferase [Planctomycetota bacterium]